jgi:hypothetical protein
VSLASPASAQVEPLTRFLGGILGFNTDDGEQIEYRERAPLVVPPNAGQLRSPAQGNAAERRGNWPRDPDVAARQRAAADRSRPIVLPTDRELQRPMTLEEIRQGRVAGAELPRNPQGMVRDQDLANEIGGVAALREMDSRSAIRRDEELQPGVEPRRAFLTDPPSGLRMPAGNRPIVVTRDAGGDRRPEGSPYDIYREGPNSR